MVPYRGAHTTGADSEILTLASSPQPVGLFPVAVTHIPTPLLTLLQRLPHTYLAPLEARHPITQAFNSK